MSEDSGVGWQSMHGSLAKAHKHRHVRDGWSPSLVLSVTENCPKSLLAGARAQDKNTGMQEPGIWGDLRPGLCLDLCLKSEREREREREKEREHHKLMSARSTALITWLVVVRDQTRWLAF